MTGLFRVGLWTTALLAGSWFGLGKPQAPEVLSFAQQVRSVGIRQALKDREAHVAESPAPVTSATVPSVVRPPARPAAPYDFQPTPQQRDPSVMGGAAPWPVLNPEASTARAWMVAEGPERDGKSGRRLVTLTFDDGPFPETTPTVLSMLARHKVHATFFVIGRYLDGDGERARASREVLRKIVAEGHLVGNHTRDHALLTSERVSHTQVLEQIDEGAASIQRTTGKYPHLFRPPFGKLDDFGRDAARERKLDVVLWSLEVQDMKREDRREMFRDLVSQLEYKEGGMVLLHDIRWSSVAVLKNLLAWLYEHRWDPKRPTRVGYEIVDLPTYLRAVEAAPLPFDSRDELERARADAWQRTHKRRPPSTD